jgi:hypothetical protein
LRLHPRWLPRKICASFRAATIAVSLELLEGYAASDALSSVKLHLQGQAFSFDGKPAATYKPVFSVKTESQATEVKPTWRS